MKTFLSNKIISRIQPLDVRSIALFRMILGAFIIWNIIGYRFPYVDEFYSNDGIILTEAIDQIYTRIFDLLLWVESDLWVYSILSVALLLAFLFTIGWRTRLVTPLLYVLFLGIINSNPYVVHGADFFLEVSLFWAIFLPLNNAWSIKKSNHAPNILLLKIATVAFLLQLFCIYFSNVISKDGEIWMSGKALELVTQDWMHGYFLADFIAQHPYISAPLTYMVIVMELAAALLVVFPFYSDRLRTIAAFFIITIHLGIALALDLGPFYGAGLAFGALLLPASFWNRFYKRNTLPKTLIKTAQKPFDWTAKVQVFGVVFFTLLMLQGTVRNWGTATFLERPIKAVPILYKASRLRPSFAFSIHGFWQQRWMYFSNEIHRELGTYCFTIVKENGTEINLHTGQIIQHIEDKNGNQWIDPIPEEPFDNTMYIFAIRSRYFQEELQQETFENWLSHEAAIWEREHPEEQIKASRLYFISNIANSKGHQLEFDRSVRLMAKH